MNIKEKAKEMTNFIYLYNGYTINPIKTPAQVIQLFSNRDEILKYEEKMGFNSEQEAWQQLSTGFAPIELFDISKDLILTPKEDTHEQI